MGLTILQIGNYAFAHCTEVHLARDLENLGHTVIRFQEPPGGGTRATLRELRVAVSAWQPDLVMWTRTWGLPPDATDFWRWCEARGVVTASYHLDLYFGLVRENQMQRDPFWTTQHVFTPDGNEESERRFKALGINHHWMPPAIVSDECVPGTFREEFAHDVVFVGSRNYHPEWPWRQELIDGLAERYGDRFVHYGHSWETTVRTGLHPPGVEEPGLWLNDLYASAKVVVGDSLNLPRNTRYISDRYFEVMGRGGLLVAPYVPVLDELGIRGGIHCLLYTERDLNIIFRLIDGSLTEPLRGWSDCTEGLVEQGAKFVADNHTYAHRLRKALSIMGFD